MPVTVTKHVLPREGEAPLVTAWSNYVPVLNHGFVRLEAALASDLDPVNSARVSFDGRSTLHNENCYMVTGADESVCTCPTFPDLPKDQLSKRDKGLINFLVREKHGTPTEHSFFRLEVKAPIFVFREWHRHRIGISINEQSGRYMQLHREFWVPEREDFRVKVGKPGAYTFVRDDDDERAAHAMDRIANAGNRAFDDYEEMLERGVAMEMARAVLPVSTYSTMWYSMNPRSMMSFLALRNAPNAQREIRAYAEVMEEIFTQVMPLTAAAFVANGRVSP